MLAVIKTIFASILKVTTGIPYINGIMQKGVQFWECIFRSKKLRSALLAKESTERPKKLCPTSLPTERPRKPHYFIDLVFI